MKFTHSAQAKIYGYMYAFNNTLKDINITVMYVNSENYDIKDLLQIIALMSWKNSFMKL